MLIDEAESAAGGTAAPGGLDGADACSASAETATAGVVRTAATLVPLAALAGGPGDAAVTGRPAERTLCR
jgi:hypothetical protein